MEENKKEEKENAVIEKTLQELELKDDFMFSQVMSDPVICKEFLEKLLNIKIKKVEIPEAQKTIDNFFNNRGVRFDVYLQGIGEMYDVEMQTINKYNLPKRMRYYQAAMDMNYLKKGAQFNELPKSYVIFICTFDPLKLGKSVYRIKNKYITHNEDNTLLIKDWDDGTEKIILNTKFEQKEDLNSEIVEMLKYIDNPEDGEETFGTLVDALKHKVKDVKNNEEVERIYMTLMEKYEEKYELGKADGFNQGIKEGITQGTQEGRAREIVEMAIEFGLTKEKTLERLQKKLEIELEEAELYLKKYSEK